MQSTYRLCQQFNETTEHISACPILANEHTYKDMIVCVCAELHFNICKEIGVQLHYEQWYKQVPKLGETSHEGKVPTTQNQQVQANRTTSNNKLDIKSHDNDKGARMLIDVAISGARNVIKKEVEKILKYKDLTTEIQRMWNVKTRVIPVITGATGTISKSLRKYLRLYALIFLLLNQW